MALLSLVTGVASLLLGGGLGWAIAALLIGAVVPFTLIGIMPTNNALLAPGRDLGAEETRTLLEHWAKLHVVRTALRRLVLPRRSYTCVSRSDPDNRFERSR
jgi:hypothetical protein